METERKSWSSREHRVTVVLDAAADMFYARGVHEVGMDELIARTGLGKATVYRLFPTKAELIGAYLTRLSESILSQIDSDVAQSDPAGVLLRIVDAVDDDLRRATFRGCPFNNASIEFSDTNHPARAAARAYREQLARRLTTLSKALAGEAEGGAIGAQLATLIDGAYTNAAHLGPDGPAAHGLDLARQLVHHARSVADRSPS
ncbi:TetR/AcrR family transcriptional regulator [Jatrophihabitans telluris]|uniref:TetR/AcrR family transcriptional regulator n=1 Tax=Jatrophihabitans telluris TaxID=2038343 RepID=A0ABY4QW21_9ACTN|nr:TetR/AcrR family transcriptional regulator [Jatrophihabitans telluris]UQX87031.1 TetR/AcrR family transcriptional regulator [Jatrophihabitans telluris]